MNYDKFRFEAVVDWIDLEIETITSTQAWRIQKATDISFVAACNLHTRKAHPKGSANTPSTLFRLRIQEPKKWADVAKLINDVADNFPLAAAPTVCGIELAFDAYCKGEPSQQELAELIVHMFRRIKRFADRDANPDFKDNRRLYKDFKGSRENIPVHEESFIRYLIDGYQIGIGREDADHYQHLYLKTTDKKPGEERRTLMPHDQHARFENRLQGDMLPCHSIAEWSAFKFEDLAKYFQFRTLKNEDGLLPQLLLSRGYVGEELSKEKQEKLRRKHRSGTLTVSDLRDAARYKLRDLSKRWKVKRSSTMRKSGAKS